MLPNWLYGKSKSKLAELLGGGGAPSDYNQVKAQVTQNTEDIASLDDALDTKAALTQISNPNLLDNSWFTVNQRGSTSYTLAQNKYGFDRWYANAGGEIISKSDDTISLNGSTINKYSGLAQLVERDRLKVGETYTLSILFSDGEVEYKTFTLASSGTEFLGVWNHAPKFNAVIISSRSNTLWGILPFDALTNFNATASFKAIKLEKGSISTLAMDTAPDMALELLKCQRYFHKYATEALRPSNMYDCVPEMRATPTQSTITIDSTTYYVNSAEL